MSSLLPNFVKIIAVCLLILPTHAKSIPNYQREFENLPQKKRDAFYKDLLEAQRLFSQQRIFEALEVIAEAEKLISDFPALLSIKGACYVEFRDFKKAENLFKKSLELSPNNVGINFNLGEIYFVQSKWKQCQPYFQKVVTALEDKPMDDTYLLAEFKSYIADKKLKHSTAAKKIEAKYDFTCDKPIYYYINAVKEMEGGNQTEGQKWLLRARKVHTTPGKLDAWYDCLVEAGYIKSFYGGGDREELNRFNRRPSLKL